MSKDKIIHILIGVIIGLLLASSLFYALQLTSARQGCCSHHGGVCGCGCCDGTSLSSTCAPYYDCDYRPAPTPKPVVPVITKEEAKEKMASSTSTLIKEIIDNQKPADIQPPIIQPVKQLSWWGKFINWFKKIF